MTRSFILLGLVLFVVGNTDAHAGDSLSRTRVLQNEWHKCLNSSYRIAIKKFDDHNAAAEVAFAACKTEEDHLLEDELVTTGTALGFASLKAAVKDSLIQDGKLKLFR